MRDRSKTVYVTLALFLCINSCGLLGGDDTSPEELPLTGKIVFAAKDDNRNSQIFTMNADGSDVKQLTHFPPDGEAYSPSWSPDGKQIMFSSAKGGISTGPALWVMDADGGNQRFLHHSDPGNEHSFPIIGNHPRWSPDGTKVAFDICLNCQIATDNTIWVFDTLSKELTQLTEHWESLGHPASDRFPTWSPDGTQIAFSSNRDYVNEQEMRYRTDLYVIDVDGSGIQRITEKGFGGLPIWDARRNDISHITFKSTNPVPGLYLLNLATGKISTVREEVSEYNSIYPYSWSINKIQLLAGTYERNSDPEERNTISSLFILNTQTGTLEKIISRTSPNSNPAISSADWFVPENE